MTSLFSKPKSPPPKSMPDEDELKKARKRKVSEVTTRSGRESTILSDRPERFG